jgi:predicted phage terminase large subunit-like protein
MNDDYEIEYDFEEGFYDEPDYEEKLLIQVAHGIARTSNIEKIDLIEWGQKYFPHYLTQAPSRQHHAVANEIKRMNLNRGSKTVIKGPRDSAKSVWCTFILPLFSICEQTEQYIQLYADAADQSEKYLEAIRHELVTNHRIANDYPFAFGEGARWQTRSILTKNGLRVDALSTGKKIRGRREKQWRPSLIIVDDPENEDHIYSALRRERNRNWFHKAVEKSGNRYTNILGIGTSLHRECLVEHLSKTPGWKAFEFRALMQYPENMTIWQNWKNILCRPDDDQREIKALAYFQEHRETMEQGADVLWPERETLYDLMLMWAADRVAFESEKQNNPIDPEACEFPPDYFDYRNFWFDEWPDQWRTRIATLDPSKGKDVKRGDYSAICLLQEGVDGYLYVDFDMARRPSRAVCQDFVGHCKTFQPDLTAIETNQFQELLIDDIEELAKEFEISIAIQQIENTVNKELRIRRCGPYLSKRMVRFRNTKGSKLCVEQLKDFGPMNQNHDDGPDAFEMALRILPQIEIKESPLDQNTEGWPEG